MFAYCLDNPINYLDGSGTDAIWIQEKNSAEGMGHTGLLVQDGNGNWYYFYWGPIDPNAFFLEMFFYTDEICVFIDLGVNGSDIQDIDDVRTVLQNCPNAADARVGEQSDDITNIIYLKGDYTNSFEYLSSLSESVSHNNSTIQYSLFFNNCSQQSTFALSKTNPEFLFIDSLIPNFAYSQVLIMSSTQCLSKDIPYRRVMP